MYIYVNARGQIKEVVNDVALRRANDNINHIYLYCEGLPTAEVTMGLIRYKLPSGVITPEVEFSLETVRQIIPYDKKRDLRFFKDYQEYDFYDITIPDGEDPLIPNVLAETGLVEFTARFVDNVNRTIYALETSTFYVEDSVVKKTEFITGDQYNYLLKLITATVASVVANPIGTPTGNLLTIKIGDVIYKVSIDNYLKEISVEDGTNRKTYTIKDDKDRETSIVSPVNWLVDAILGSGGYVTINKSDGSAIQFQVPDDDYIVNAVVEGSIVKLTKKNGTVVQFTIGGGGSIDDYCDSATYDATTHVLTLTFADNRTPTTVPVPYLTSQLVNDSGFIGSAALALYYKKTEIDALSVSHFNNDAGYITADVDNLTNYTKTADLAAVATSNDYRDLDYTPEIVDNLTTNDATKVLSAKQGYEINQRLQAVEGLGRFLSVWDASDGYPEDLPPADQLPYELKNGYFYIVGSVAGSGGTNYKPHVTIIGDKGYFIDSHSTDVESTQLHAKDIYIYNGATKEFRLISDSSADVYWLNIKGNDPMVNLALAALFNDKQKKLINNGDFSINHTTGEITFLNGTSKFIALTALSVASGIHLTYNNGTGQFGIETGYGIPLTTDITQITTNKNAIAAIQSALEDDYQQKSDNSLSTTDKTIVGAINEIDAAVKGLDFTGYQTRIDPSIIVPTGEDEATVVGAINWLYNNKLDKDTPLASPSDGDTIYGMDKYGNSKRFNAGDLRYSYVGKVITSPILDTVEKVIAAEGGTYWEKISDFDDIPYFAWQRTDVLPTYNVTLTSSTLHFQSLVVQATWGVKYINTLVINASATGNLPSEIVVKVNGVELTVEDDYDYDDSTGRFEIHANKVKGPIEIIAEAE